MDKLEYIPGDLVMTNGIPIGTKKGIVYQVTESNPDKYRPVEDGNSFTELKGSVTLSNIKGKTVDDECFLFGDCGAWVKDIVPIPLTPEILEKNGWKRTQIFIDDDGLEFHTYIDDERCLDLQYYPQYKKFAAFICKQEVLSDIEYVHQLQHLLFGLDLPMDLKV